MQSKLLFYCLLLLLIACSPEDEQDDLPEPFFKATINNQPFYYNNTFPSFNLESGINFDTQDSMYTQRISIGEKWASNPHAVDIEIFFDQKTTVPYLQNLVGQHLSYQWGTFPYVIIKVYNGAHILNAELSNSEFYQAGSNFVITEVIEDPMFTMNHPLVPVGKAFLAKGVCNFKTPNLHVTNGEFVIRLMEIK